MIKKLCKYCNNSVKIGDNEYLCLGGKKENLVEFEKNAKKLKNSLKSRV